MNPSSANSETTARGIGLDFGAAECRIAVQSGSSCEVLKLRLREGVESPKRHLGMQRPDNDAVATAMLRHVREEAERRYSIHITKARLAVPPCFEDKQKAAALHCAEQSGFATVQLVDDSVAAAMYSMNSGTPRGRWLIFGLGKCAFYATLIETQARLDVKAHAGDIRLGGDDFDRLLGDELRRRYPVLASMPETIALRIAEQCKKMLSSEEVAEVEYAIQLNLPLRISLDRAGLERVLTPAIGKTIATVRQLLDEQHVAAAEIDRVLAIGEAARMPLVERWLRETVPAPLEHLESDAVCRGAAMLSTSMGDCFEPRPATRQQPAPVPGGDDAETRPMATRAAALAASGPDRLRLYYQFLDEAREELAYMCMREAGRQEALGRAKDGMEALEHFLEWKSEAGKKTVRDKLIYYYLAQAYDLLREAQANKTDRERRDVLKRCGQKANRVLEIDPKNAKAKELKRQLGR